MQFLKTRKMDKVLATFLLVLVTVLCGLGNAQTSDIVLKADPLVITDGVTEEIAFNCRPLSGLGKVGIVLRLFKSNGSDEMPVATATQQGEIIVDDESASATGHISNAGDDKDAFLAVTIKDPSFTEEGIFTCQYAYMDDKYAIHKVSASVNISVEEEIIPTTVMTTSPEVPNIQDDESVNATACNCDDVWEEINSLKETLLLENQLLKKEVQKYDDSCRVSFSARMANDAPIIQDVKVIFDDVISNKGGAFEESSFLAPCTGQYFFSLTLRSNQMMDGGYVDGVIMAADQEVARTSVFSDFSAMNYQSATNGAVVTLTQGEEVNVKVKTTSRGKLIGSTHSVFSGFYLYP